MQTAGAPDTLGKFNPGLGAQDFSLFESAKFVPKGSDLVFSIHYTATGKAATDRSKVGLVFAKHPPKFRYFVTTARRDRTWRSLRAPKTRRLFPR